MSIPKQFCVKGHDTHIVGRTTSRGCRTCANKASDVWRRAHPDMYRPWQRASKWASQGIKNVDGSRFTPVDYDRQYQIQGGKCVGCMRHQSELKERLNADHDHKTGTFRFLLCSDCNHVLGMGKDNPTILRRLADALDSLSKESL